MKHLAVVMDGGLIERFISNDPAEVPELLVIDLDTEGLPEEELTDVVSLIGEDTRPASFPSWRVLIRTSS